MNRILICLFFAHAKRFKNVTTLIDKLQICSTTKSDLTIMLCVIE